LLRPASRLPGYVKVTNLVVAGVAMLHGQSSFRWQTALSPSCWGLPWTKPRGNPGFRFSRSGGDCGCGWLTVQAATG